jgi:uncharacterized protein (DUF2384 family)
MNEKQIYCKLLDIMISKCILEKWLDTPNKQLHNKRPRYLMLSEDGREMLSELITKLQSKN